MNKKKRIKTLLILFGVLVILLAGILLLNGQEKDESITEAMTDAVLHETNRVSLFGILEVNPALISAFVVTAIFLIFAAGLRIFAIPRFQMNHPGKVQLLLETWVGYFDELAKNNSPHRTGFLSFYTFAAGSYICVSTLFELLGLQAVTTRGTSVSLPAPLADINGAIAMGFLSYGVILAGGIRVNKLRGAGKTLKDFSLPFSMSFRLFGALLSGMLVTELVYYTAVLSFVIPVIVGVLFTLIHALIQTYVLTTLVAYFYGEVTEPPVRQEKRITQKANLGAGNLPASMAGSQGKDL